MPTANRQPPTANRPALVQAFKQLDYGQYKLVHEALHERGVLLRNVPYLSKPLPIMTVGVVVGCLWCVVCGVWCVVCGVWCVW